jgi:MFS family permease
MLRSRRNVAVLAASLTLTQVGTSLVMVVSALAGHYLAADKALSTLPLALQFTATMLSTIPASLFMDAVGRRAGFTLGQLLGAAGAAVSAYALFIASFPLFAAGSLLLGVHNAFWQYYRFAAADTAEPEYRSRAISYVLAGGVVAALIGPEAAKLTRPLFEPVLFAGSYAFLVLLNGAAILLLQFIDIPKPARARGLGSGRPLIDIVRRPAVAVAMLSAMAGYGVMSLVMTATPLAVIACGFAFADAAFVIQWHAVGMFAPSFFTGHLIRRFGVLEVIMAGVLLNALCMAINLMGVQLLNFWSALVLLGLGWNFMFVGGTTLLTECYAPEEKAKVQGLNDFLVFTVVALASFSAGAIQHWVGWAAVNAAVALPLLIALAATAWLRAHPKRPRMAA